MASNRVNSKVLRQPRKFPLLMLVAVFFYAIGIMSGRIKFDGVTRYNAKYNKLTDQVEFSELLIDINGTEHEEERCVRTFTLEYREQCHQTMFGYQVSNLVGLVLTDKYFFI
jgi:hypothetical protein